MPPAFFILDGCAVDGRDGLYGIATTPCQPWWDGEIGRIYGGRHGGWGVTQLSGAPVSLTYRRPAGEERGAWIALLARKQLAQIQANSCTYCNLPVPATAVLRRVRAVADGVIVVGGDGLVLRGEFPRWRPVRGLERDGRFLTDACGRSTSDFVVVGRGGAVFHWTGKRWDDWSPGGGDLHVALRRDHQIFVAGDGGRVLERRAAGWEAVAIQTSDPVVGLTWFAGALWAATPTAVFTGREALLPAPDPGFGGMLGVGDGALYCFGAAEVARWDGERWTRIEHPDQRDPDPPPAWPSLGQALDQARKPPVHPAAELGGRLYTDSDAKRGDRARWAKLSIKPGVVRDIVADLGSYAVLEVEGDLHVPGDLSLLARKLIGLIVHGDLIVDGVFSDSDHPATYTFVGGSLRCRTIITSGQLEVVGELRCSHLVGDYNDYGAVLRGPVHARLFFAEYHAFEFGVPPHIDVRADDRIALAAVRPELLRGGPGVMPEERELDRERVLAELRQGASIFRDDAATPGMRDKPVARARRGAGSRAAPATTATRTERPRTPKPKPKPKPKPSR